MRLYHYKIPFRTSFRTAKGDFMFREGLIIEGNSNIRSEIAPLPGFSNESCEDVLQFLQNNSRTVNRHYELASLDSFLSEELGYLTSSDMPSLRFGLSMLSEQQKAVNAGLPLFLFWKHRFKKSGGINENGANLHSDSIGSLPLHSSEQSAIVNVNAVVGMLDHTSLIHKIASYENAGFTTVKVKLPPDWKLAFSLIIEVCRKFPRLLFRFDANGVFSETDAHHLLRVLEAENLASGIATKIDYLEEPVNQPDKTALAGLRNYKIRLAADESVRTPKQLQDMLQMHAFDTLVLKPMLFGSMADMESIWDAVGEMVRVTISSSLESIVGRTLLVHIAAFVDFMRQTDHGLATGNLFESDLPYSVIDSDSDYRNHPNERDLKINRDDTGERKDFEKNKNTSSDCDDTILSGPRIKLSNTPGSGLIPKYSSTGIHDSDSVHPVSGMAQKVKITQVPFLNR